MLKNRKILIIFIISLLSASLFGQDSPDSHVISTPSEITQNRAENSDNINTSVPSTNSKTIELPKKTILNKIDVILQFEPVFYFSPESRRNNSNIVNITYAFTIGTSFPRDNFVSFQPTLSFFTMNHLWFGNIALPTEIENRTTTTLSFMLNLPAAFNIFFKQSRLQLTAGAGLLLRSGILSSGVDKNDSGYSGSAASDVKLIKKWFWEKGRWLYISAGASWLYNVTPEIKVGPTLNLYLPFTSFIEYKKPQDLILTIGFRICR